MEVKVRRPSGDPSDMQPAEGNMIIEITKGAGGKRWVEVPKASLAGKSHREIVRMAIDGIGPGDPFAGDMSAILNDRSYSLEQVTSGVQSRWVNRDAPIDASEMEQEMLRYSVSRDHTGGR